MKGGIKLCANSLFVKLNFVVHCACTTVVQYLRMRISTKQTPIAEKLKLNLTQIQPHTLM